MEIKSYITNISKKVTDHLRTQDSTSLLEIKKSLEKYFKADEFCYFLYSKSSLTLKNIFDKNPVNIVLNNGLIKESISQSSALCVDRVHSHKLYCPEVDNIYNIKIKSMMIVPIHFHNATMGILVLYKNVKRRTLFTEIDVKNLGLLLPSLEKITTLMEGNGKNHSRHLPARDKEKQQAKRPKEHANAKKQDNLDLELEVKALKALLHDVQKENKTLSGKLVSIEKENTSLKENTSKVVIEDEEYKSLAIKYDAFVEKYFAKEEENKTIIKKYKKDYDALNIQHKEKINDYDKHIDELNNKIIFLTQEQSKEKSNEHIDSNITEISLLENKLEYFENKVKELEEEKRKNIKKYNQDIFSISSNDDANHMDKISNILLSCNKKFSENKYAYMFFELILYAIEYKRNLTYLNDKFENSKIIFDLLEQYTLPINVDINQEVYVFSSLIDKIKIYERKLFEKPIKIIIKKDKLIPHTLKIDMPKLQSVIYYILMDFSTFIDIQEKLTIDISHDKSYIFVDILGQTLKKKALFGFKNTTPVKEISERPELQFARILLNSLDMDIESHYKARDYRLSFSIPYENIV